MNKSDGNMDKLELFVAMVIVGCMVGITMLTINGCTLIELNIETTNRSIMDKGDNDNIKVPSETITNDSISESLTIPILE